MGARIKLNVAFVNGTLIVAAGLGLVTQSWIVYFVAAAIGIGFSLHAGDIRLKGRRD